MKYLELAALNETRKLSIKEIDSNDGLILLDDNSVLSLEQFEERIKNQSVYVTNIKLVSTLYKKRDKYEEKEELKQLNANRRALIRNLQQDIKMRTKGYRTYYKLEEYPDLLKEFDIENNIITPQMIKTTEPTLLWWKCSQGHSFQKLFAERVCDKTCPECLKEKLDSE